MPALAYSADLHDLRSARRAAVRSAALAKAEDGAPFGLLVIPVDFADARFPHGYDPAGDLSPRLGLDAPGALGHYFAAASQQRTRLVVQLAPVVALSGARHEYSDIGWQGNERTRRLATEALAGAAARGANFADSDLDDDGEVDGVLILHAAPGLENDPDGLIVPLQFFLEEPVIQRGVVGRFYAVASQRSTLGIWAHETGHLLGLEDRYDPFIGGGGEHEPRGGLGMFSLMSAGWLGSGDGSDPALPDGYSRLQLGWVDPAAHPGPGTVLRIAVAGGPGPESFLCEQRSPTATPPYDGALPDSRLLVYHVDESLAEGEASSSDWNHRHLRVHLLEADGGDEVFRGESQGEIADLFPTSGASQDLDDDTVPGTRPWHEPDRSGVALTIALVADTLQVTNRSAAPWIDLRLVFETGDGEMIPRLLARTDRDHVLPDRLDVTLTCASTEFGQFAGGATMTATLVPLSGHPWAFYASDGTHRWQPAGQPGPGDVTRFDFEIAGIRTGALTWVWDTTFADPGPDFDSFASRWTIEYPEGVGTTSWHFWTTAPWGGARSVMICTGAEHTSGSGWPEVSYGNDDHVRILSPSLGTDATWLQMTHALDLELLTHGTAVDGVALDWVHAAGYTTPATPVDGWLGTVDSRAQHALAGAPTFALADSLLGAGFPLWHREALPLPDPAVHGPGPWQLRLSLASNALWRGRGWCVLDLTGHLDGIPDSAFPIRVEADQLHWTWRDAADQPVLFTIQSSIDGGATWVDALSRDWAAGGGPDYHVPLSDLGLSLRVNTWLRVAAGDIQDRVVSRAVSSRVAGDLALSLPAPNPFADVARIMLDGAGDPQTDLGLYDLRGRRIRRWRPGGDLAEVRWDGTDAEGRRVAAGVYIFRLNANGRTETRKVTWLP